MAFEIHGLYRVPELAKSFLDLMRRLGFAADPTGTQDLTRYEDTRHFAPDAAAPPVPVVRREYGCRQLSRGARPADKLRLDLGHDQASPETIIAFSESIRRPVRGFGRFPVG